ncbi:MAG: winged helix-turn-helix domain-containing protein [Anaerolineaceae bacterium]|nr:winged helix-turn-helix domain-containing protein [Anaerolineaceae bacterium]
MPLTQETVRTAMLAAQGLLAPPKKQAEKADLLPIIRQMGYLQIDTIQAVRRSQNLVLWSRLGDYEVDWLDELHAEVQLFEYYAHALCYLPIEDFPIFRGFILNGGRATKYWQKWAEQHPDIIASVLEAVRENGPLCSLDFEGKTISTGWGSVKHEKAALDHLFVSGELMVTHREKFRRFYDLRKRVLPEWDDADALDPEAGHRQLLLKTIRALGVAREDWLTTYYYRVKNGLSDTMNELVAAGRVLSVEVEGWEQPAYVHSDQAKLVEAAAAGKLTPSATTLLSPFDPLISDRDRALDLFNFDYRLEAYTPVKDRKYGHFSLPILHKGRLIGRLDPKAHRKEKRLEIRKIYLEPGVRITDELAADLRNMLQAFTAWHGLETLEIVETDPVELREALV